MSRRRRCFVGILAGVLLMGGLGIWWLSQKSVPPAPAESQSTTARSKPKTRPPGAGTAGVPVAAPAAEALPEFGTEAFKELVRNRGAAWLASRNRDAVSLLAMFDLTGDEAYVREAAEKFPGSPQASLAMLNLVLRNKGSAEEQKRWAEQFIAAAPNNPLGPYFLAGLHAKSGNATEVMAALESALANPGRMDFYLRERKMGAKEGLLAGGATLEQTYHLALVGPMQQAGQDIMVSPIQTLNGFFRDRMKELAAPGREEERQDMAALGLRMAEQIKLSESPMLITELLAFGMKMSFLKQLDPGTEIANTGRTAAGEIEAMAGEKAARSEMIHSGRAVSEFLQNAPVEIQGQYSDRSMMDGEIAAMRYAMEEMKKANPPPE